MIELVQTDDSGLEYSVMRELDKLGTVKFVPKDGGDYVFIPVGNVHIMKDEVQELFDAMDTIDDD